MIVSTPGALEASEIPDPNKKATDFDFNRPSCIIADTLMPDFAMGSPTRLDVDHGPVRTLG